MKNSVIIDDDYFTFMFKMKLMDEKSLEIYERELNKIEKELELKLKNTLLKKAKIINNINIERFSPSISLLKNENGFWYFELKLNEAKIKSLEIEEKKLNKIKEELELKLMDVLLKEEEIKIRKEVIERCKKNPLIISESKKEKESEFKKLAIRELEKKKELEIKLKEIEKSERFHEHQQWLRDCQRERNNYWKTEPIESFR